VFGCVGFFCPLDVAPFVAFGEDRSLNENGCTADKAIHHVQREWQFEKVVIAQKSCGSFDRAGLVDDDVRMLVEPRSS